MDFYPSDFSPGARDRIEKEKIRAYRDLLPSSVYDFKDRDLAIRCVMRIFLSFAKEACELRIEHGWTIERIENESKEFWRRLTLMVLFDKFTGLHSIWISNWDGSVRSDVERQCRASAEWTEYEELLLATPLAATRKPASSIMREASINAMLEKKGLSVRQWANDAKVDFHTADNYLKGKTKPYPDTLKKLADALGVDVSKLLK